MKAKIGSVKQMLLPAAGIAAGLANRMKKASAEKKHQKVTSDDLQT